MENLRTRTGLLFVALATLSLLATPTSVGAQEHRHDDDSSADHHDGLHFSHPLIAESPSPDTKLRIDYELLDGSEDEMGFTQGTARLEAEYAIHRSFSIEVDVPFTTLNPDLAGSESSLGNVELGLKFANFAFERYGLLLGYGVEMGLPTGDEAKGIGSDNIIELEPFFNVAYKREALELVAFGKTGVPFNQNEGQEVETELAYNFSALYHFGARVQGLLELDGETVLSGDEAGASVLHFNPGVKVRPLQIPNLIVGAGIGIPVTDLEEFDVRGLLSVFWHF